MPQIYDVTNDTMREVTQADVDAMMKRLNALAAAAPASVAPNAPPLPATGQAGR